MKEIKLEITDALFEALLKNLSPVDKCDALFGGIFFRGTRTLALDRIVNAIKNNKDIITLCTYNDPEVETTVKIVPNKTEEDSG